MLKIFELYFDDLNEETQKEILDFYQLKSKEEGNFEESAIAILEIDTEE